MSVTLAVADGPVEDQEPIFGLAAECETLYAKRINTLNDNDEPDAGKLLSELQQRFAAWASFLGVFSEPNVYLDRRLRHHVEIQDNVLRLLDIMHTSLTCLFDGESPSMRMDVDYSPTAPSHRFYISLSSLDAISGAVDRLNQLALVIRRSSITSETVKARRFAERFDLSSFETLAYRSLKTLYPDASESLREQLARSMTEIYALFLRRRSRQQHLGVPRSAHQASPLSPIKEEIPGADAGGPMELDLQIPQPSGELDLGALHLHQFRPQRQGPLTEPTSIDSHEVRAKMRKLFDPSRRGDTKKFDLPMVLWAPSEWFNNQTPMAVWHSDPYWEDNNGKMPSHNSDQCGTETHHKPGVDGLPSKPPNVEVVAAHIAAHLQFLMLLTLRLISTDNVIGTSNDEQSSSPNTDDRGSDLRSDGTDRKLDIGSRSDDIEFRDWESEFDFESQLENQINDSDEIDWGYVLDPHAPDDGRGAHDGMDVDAFESAEAEPVFTRQFLIINSIR